MKWIFLLLVMSCGKHETPAARDLQDSDGDLIYNYNEDKTGSDKYIADMTPLTEIDGEMTFNIGNEVKKEATISLSNRRDLTNEFFNLLTNNLKLIQVNDYFMESAELVIMKNESLANQMTNPNYLVSFRFKNEVSQNNEIMLIKNNESRNLGPLIPKFLHLLTKDELQSLLLGKAHLAIKNREKEENIKKNTYRVFLYDKNQAIVNYVSKKLDFEDLKKRLNILSTQDITDIDLFNTQADDLGRLWWVRNFLNGDKVLIHCSYTELVHHYLDLMQTEQIDLKRINGSSTIAKKLNKNKDAKIFWKLRAEKQDRQFEDFTTTDKYSRGTHDGPEEYYCQNFYTEIKSEQITNPSFKEIWGNIELKSAGALVNLVINENLWIKEKTDEKGVFWEMTLELALEEIELTLKNHDPTKFVKKGLYQITCPGKGKSRKNVSYELSHPEGYLNLQIESYIEKVL